MLYLTDEKPYYGSTPIADAPQELRRAGSDIDRLHREIELYKKTWLAACHDIAELEEANQIRRSWSAAWKTAAQTWRKIDRYHQVKTSILYAHIDTQEARIRDLHEDVGRLKAKVKDKDHALNTNEKTILNLHKEIHALKAKLERHNAQAN